ncbi:MAG: carbamate kinase [candidate division WOR-3 bacterium]
MAKICVCAIGGNSLIRGPNNLSFYDQYETVKKTCGHLVPIIKSGYELVLTHGNGPQVGFLLLRSHFSRNLLPEIPLETGNAMTQGEIGYMISEAFTNILKEEKMNKEVVAILTRVLVNLNDLSFKRPSKPIGPFYSRVEALELQKRYNWVLREDAGRGYRRIVPSPEPIDILEKEAIKDLLFDRKIVIATGGGGIPVVKKNGYYQGIAAVIDKDLATSLLATLIGAELFIISTAVDGVYLNYGKPKSRLLPILTIKDCQKYLKEGQFPEGSMGPKIKAAIKFLQKGGKEVIITSPEKISQALKGKTGTKIVP